MSKKIIKKKKSMRTAQEKWRNAKNKVKLILGFKKRVKKEKLIREMKKKK
jgi:hypothetical protein